MILAKQSSYTESLKIHELSLENLHSKDKENNSKDHHMPNKVKIRDEDLLDPPSTTLNKVFLPASPTSFKVSPSEASDETNETSPSSVEQIDEDTSDITNVLETESIDDRLLYTKTNETQTHPADSEKNQDIEHREQTHRHSTEQKYEHDEQYQEHEEPEEEAPLLCHTFNSHKFTSSNNNTKIHDIDPHHIPDDMIETQEASIGTYNNNDNNNNSINHRMTLKNRRHTTPASSLLISKQAQQNKNNNHKSQTDINAKPPASRNTFSSTASVPVVPGATYKTRSRTSMDLNVRQDSTNAEINRMRNSILVRRNIKKKRKEFLEDEKVLVGNKISEGHENFVMAYNMLTGIRVAVSRNAGIMKKINDEDFSTTKKLSFNMDGSELTPSSKYDFKFKDYSPAVFRELRSIFGLDPADYLVSITGKYILSELGSPGKSGSFFYYSRDYRFIIKTIHHSEHKQLRRSLKQYYEHVKSNPNTLVSQIYGLHRVKIPAFGANNGGGGLKKVHFLVMNNLFPPHRDIHVKYDLKGSTWGRTTRLDETLEGKAKEDNIASHTLKDLNWLERKDTIKFGPLKKKLFFDQLESDVKFLEKINVMDYSLLLGIHDTKRGNSMSNEVYKKLSVFDPKLANKADLINTNPRDIDRINDLPTNVFPGRSQYIFYGHDGGIRATNEDNDPLGEIYYLGIIDCLTNYSVKKRLETFWRSLSHARQTISAVPSKEYGERFLNFIKKGVTTPKKKVS